VLEPVVASEAATLIVVAAAVAEPAVGTAVPAAFVSVAEIVVLAAIVLWVTWRLVCAVSLRSAAG
jgi:hypothetical protein